MATFVSEILAREREREKEGMWLTLEWRSLLREPGWMSLENSAAAMVWAAWHPTHMACTWSFESSSTRNVISICGMPAGAGGIPRRSN